AAVARWARHGGDPAESVGRGLRLRARALEFEDPEGLKQDPGRLLDLFEQQARLGADLSWGSRALARELAPAAARAMLERGGAVDRLARILTAPHAELAGLEMLDAGLLGALIPELDERRDLVQFDDFHLHPLGEHTIKTVARLGDLLRGSDPRFRRASQAVRRPEALLLAGLLHDVGKGEPDHARRGAQMSTAILKRLDADAALAEDVRFLVQNHLLLFEACRTLDLSDETALWRAATHARSPERLAMLVLLSAADAQATGPRAWDGWIASLLGELADKLFNMLSSGPLAAPYAASAILSRRDRIRSLAQGELSPEFVEGVLDVLDPRYALALDPESILQDMRLLRRLEQEVEQHARRSPGGRGGRGVCVLRAEPASQEQAFNVAVAAKDQPGLFAAMAGVFCLLSVDVLGAGIHTFGRGLVLDRFTVSAAQTRLDPEELFSRVRQSIQAALTGRLSLDYRIHQKRTSPLAAPPSGPEMAPRVQVDNDSSDFFTKVEVLARDRLGLLYDLAKTLAGMGLTVHQARITTRVDAVADLFFVRDELGQKLEDPARVRELTRALGHAAGE
ncbi:MAG: HD domain-containing protein, partial [Desulfovibrionaceae bacterium]